MIEKGPPSRATQIGNLILADFTLIECPTWAVVEDRNGDPDLARQDHEWPRTHVHPLCIACGRSISTDATCPRMKAPEAALGELLRLKLPAEDLHAEVPGAPHLATLVHEPGRGNAEFVEADS